MAFRWVCTSCGELHGTNPSTCRSCGGSVFSPASKKDVDRYSYERGDTRALDPDDIGRVGSNPSMDDVEIESSPDVLPDGSVEGVNQDESVSLAGSLAPLWLPIGILFLLLFMALIYLL